MVWNPPAWETDEERRKREQDEIGLPALGRAISGWAQDRAQQFTHDPALAALQTVGDVFHGATAYPLGVVQGVVQTGLEHLPGARPLNVEERTIGHGPFGPDRVVPEVQNILDPLEATRRYEALTPEPVQFVEDLLTGGALKVPGVVGRGIKAGLETVGRDIAPGAGLVAPLAGTEAATRVAGIAGPALNVAGRGLQIGLPVEAARETWTRTDEEQPIPLRLAETGLAALGGAAVGAWAGNAIRAQNARLRTLGQPTTSSIVENLPDETRSILSDVSREQFASRGGRVTHKLLDAEGNPITAYPAWVGGDVGVVRDGVRQALSDRLARPETLYNAATREAGPLPESMQAYPNMRLVAGAPAEAAQFTADHFRPIIQKAGLRYDQMDDFDRYRWLRMAKSEAERGGPTASGPAGMSRAEYEATGESLYHGTTRAFDKFGGPDARTRYGHPIRGGEKFYFTDDPNVARTFTGAGGFRQVDFDHWASENYVDLTDPQARTKAFDEFRRAVDVTREKGRSLWYAGDNGELVQAKSVYDIPVDLLSDGDVRLYNRGRAPRVIQTKVYGKTLDLTDPGNIPDDLRRVLEPTSFHPWENDLPNFSHEYTPQLIEWARANGYGKIKVRDTYESGFRSIIALPEHIGYGQDPHRAFVEAAIARGERVPDQTLLDYPDLAGGVATDTPVALHLGYLDKDGNIDTRRIDRDLAAFQTGLQRANPGDRGIVSRWDTATDEWTTANNRLLETWKDAGGIPQEVFDESLARHGVYGHLTNGTLVFDDITRGKVPSDRLSVTAQGVGYLKTTTDVPALRWEDDLGRVGKFIAMARKNVAMNALDEMMGAMTERNSEWGKLWLDAPMKNIGGKLQVERDAPAGFGHVMFFKDGALQARLVPKDLADALNGMGAEQLPTFARIAARLQEPFRLGITAWSLPFIYGQAGLNLQLAAERAPQGMLWQLAKNVGTASMDVIANGLDNWIAKHQNHPMVQDLPYKIARSTRDALVRMGADPNVIKQMSREGIGYASTTENLRGQESAARLLGLAGAPDTRFIPNIPLVGRLLNTADEALAGMTYLLDTAPRAAMWKLAPQAGITGVQRSLMARDAGVDFQKGGNAVRVMSALLPLFNARIQGNLISAKSFWDQPEAWMQRATAFVAVPSVALYTYNRANYGDLYDKIPTEEKDRYFNVIVGRTQDEYGRDVPIRFRIVKDPVVQLVSSPIEHFLDANYHVRAGEVEIDPRSRTPRSAQEMWFEQLGQFLPWQPRNDEMLDPMGHGLAALSMSPLAAVPVELWANRDHFTGREIVPEDERMLPPKYQIQSRTSATSKFLAHKLDEVLGRGASDTLHASPARMDYLVQGFGGSAAMQWWYMGDKILGVMQQAGLVGADPFAPQSAADLGLPADAPASASWKYLQAIPRPDNRPWWMVYIPRAFSQTGSGDSIAAKVKTLGSHEQTVWQQTRDMNASYAEVRMQEMDNLQRLYEEGGKLSHADFRKKEGDIYGRLSAAWDNLHTVYPMALTTPQERDAFMQQLPGLNMKPFTDQLPQLPPGVTPEMVYQRWMAPGGQDISGLNPFQKAQLQDRELLQMQNEYHLPAAVIKDFIGATVFERELPSIPVPALYLERALNEYRTPRDPQTGQALDPLTTAPRKWAEAQRQTVTRLAQEWGIDEDALRERIANRHLVPQESNELTRSRNYAMMVADKLHDPKVAPLFATRDGQPVGDPNDWERMQLELEAQKAQLTARRIPRAAWPASVRQLDDAQHWGEVKRVQALMADPHAADYDRWYGAGRDIPVEQWEAYQTGRIPKYKQGDPEQWLKWDMMARIYSALPPTSPLRLRMKPAYDRIKRLATPGWRALTKLDALDQEDAA